MKHILIKTFDESISAHIIKAKLESEGITCFLLDENIVTLNQMYNFAVGGIKLKVYEDDVEKALNILAEIENQPLTDNHNQVIQCPKCSSEEIYADFKSMKGPKGILSAITSVLFMVFPLYFNRVYRCKKCHVEFKIEG